MDLLELAKRCEAADGPDRELDALIWCALNGKKYVGWFDPYGEEGRATAVEYTEPPKRTRLVTHSKGHAPLFTSSIDAAMTLLNDDWGCEQRRPSNGCASGCMVSIWWVPAFPEKQYGIGRTPALALCAAALRARAA